VGRRTPDEIRKDFEAFQKKRAEQGMNPLLNYAPSAAPPRKKLPPTVALGDGARFAAAIIDVLFMGILIKFAAFPVICSVVSPAANTGAEIDALPKSTLMTLIGQMFFIGLASWALTTTVYYLFFYQNFGASPGKMLFGGQIVDAETQERIRSRQTLARELIGKPLSAATICLGFLMIPFNAQHRGLHDFLAGTKVVKSN
jgi:uncharacterized RDD family membrane protein YckC